MTEPRKPWDIRPLTKKVPVSSTLKAEVQRKADELIEKVLKPAYVKTPKGDEQFNYVTDIYAKWYRNYFYFHLVYACPRPNAISPSFEWKLARMEPLGNDKFALYAMRHTGKEWVGIFDQLSVDECMEAIQSEEWFAL